MIAPTVPAGPHRQQRERMQRRIAWLYARHQSRRARLRGAGFLYYYPDPVTTSGRDIMRGCLIRANYLLAAGYPVAVAIVVSDLAHRM